MLLSRTRTQSRPKSVLSLSLAVSLILGVFLASPTSAAVESAEVTSVTPTTGITGTLVTITGDGLSGTSSVQFGNSLGTISGTPTNSQVKVIAPAGTGTVDVKVTNTAGNVIVESAFTYKVSLTPVVTQLSPSNGLPTGFNEVTIVGSNLSSATDVKFGTVSAISFKVNSDTSITAVAPANISGTAVNVSVTNISGQSENSASYSYQNLACAPATYLNLKFAKGISKLTATQVLELKELATEFKSLGCDEVNLVRYNETIKKNMTASHKEYIKLQRARAINVYNVVAQRLRNIGGTTDVKFVKRVNQVSQAKRAFDVRSDYRKLSFVVPVVEVIDSVYPTSGPLTGGNTITITGRGLENIAATGAVKFGTTAAIYTVNTAKNTLTVTVPATAVAGSVDLTVQPSSTSAVLKSTYSYTSAPTLTAISRNNGHLAGTNSVTITGANFVGLRSVSSVKFGAVNASSFVVISSSTISAVVPAGVSPGSVNITVVNSAGTSNTLSYTYFSAPSISRVNPLNMSLSGGTITIEGSQFSGANTSISFSKGNSSWRPTSITTSTSGLLVATYGAVNSANAGLVNITVTTTGGVVTLNEAFVIGTAITAVALTDGGGVAQGPLTGETAITITGVDFPETITNVTVGGIDATNIVRVTGGTRITADTPISATTGSVPVRVYSNDIAGGYVELANAFTYVGAPTISGLSPSSVPLEGRSVMITGTNFVVGHTTVKVDGVLRTLTSSSNTTSLFFTAPADSAGTVEVLVTSVGGTATSTLTYVEAPTITTTTETEVSGPTFTISGTNFVADGGTTATFNGTSVAVAYDSPTSISITVSGSLIDGTYILVVTTAGGTDSVSLAYSGG